MLRLSVSSAILTTVMSVLRSRGLEQFGSDDKKMAALDIKPLLQFDSGQSVAKRDLICCRLCLPSRPSAYKGLRCVRGTSFAYFGLLSCCVSHVCGVLSKLLNVYYLGAVHILHNTNLGSRETPPPIVILYCIIYRQALTPINNPSGEPRSRATS